MTHFQEKCVCFIYIKAREERRKEKKRDLIEFTFTLTKSKQI